MRANEREARANSVVVHGGRKRPFCSSSPLSISIRCRDCEGRELSAAINQWRARAGAGAKSAADVVREKRLGLRESRQHNMGSISHDFIVVEGRSLVDGDIRVRVPD